MSIEDDVATRYGKPDPGGRLFAKIVLGVLALIFLWWVGWAAISFGTPDVTSQLRAYDVVDEHTATATLRVAVHNGGDATCKVRAIAEDHTVVGEASMEVSEDGDFVFTVRTERRATTVDKIGCTTAAQPRPR